VRAVIERTPGSAQVAAWVPGQTATAANGIIYGQYHAPIGEYLFPEQIVGNPVPPANFETMPFLAQGGYTSSAGTLAGQLFPWPGNPAPAGCAGPPPVAKAIGTPATVFSGSETITLDASASTGSGLAFSWVQNPADVPQVTLTGANTAQASFTVPAVAATTTLSFTVTVSNAAGSSVAQVSVNVVVGAPIVNHVNPVSVPSGTPNVTLPISGVDSGGLPLTFSATQTGGSQPLLNVAVTSTGPGTANVSFSAPTLPLGQVQPDVVTLTITATNSAGATSLPEFTSVAVNPLADVITVTSAEYRTSKQRLLINVTDSVISSNVVLTLQPYLTTTGTIFDPSGLGNVFLNQGGGLYLLDIVGAPEPAIPPATPLDVKSNLKGDSGTFGLTRIRQ
ncbi:MAG TPA: hypothetical protein VF104_10525, partial [Burkholderiales bacterium]